MKPYRTLLALIFWSLFSQSISAQNPNPGIMKAHTPPEFENVMIWDITTEQPGELLGRIPGTIYNIGRMTVSGPINSVDFETLWDISYHSRLYELFLENAVAENDVVPDYAFYHPGEQVDGATGLFLSQFTYMS